MKTIAIMLASAAGVLAAAPAMAQAANFSFTGPVGLSSGIGPLSTTATLTGDTTLDTGGTGSYTISNFQLSSPLGGENFGTGTATISGNTLTLTEGPTSTFLGTFALTNLVTNAGGFTADGTLTSGAQDLYINGNVVGLQSGSGTFSVTAAASAVPEAATWAMMIVGMGAVGFAMRRQKVTRVSYAA